MADLRHSEDFSDPPTIREIERQIRWEVDAVEAAVKRYREELEDADHLADTSPGQRLLREAMGEFIPHIRDVQDALLEQTIAPGTNRDWWTLVGLLPADKLAYLTIRAVLGSHPSVYDGFGAKLTSASLDLARSVESEVAFQDWVSDEREQSRKARKLGVAYQNQFDALRRRSKVINGRTFKRWMVRLERLWRQGWSTETRVQFGGAMLRKLCEHGAGLFESVLVPAPGGKTVVLVRITERARLLIEDHNTRAEVARPLIRPMLCRPKKWQWETAQSCMTADTTSTNSACFASV